MRVGHRSRGFNDRKYRPLEDVRGIRGGEPEVPWREQGWCAEESLHAVKAQPGAIELGCQFGEGRQR
eukprot:8353276-Alexandrium_andersonii.AAC.1